MHRTHGTSWQKGDLQWHLQRNNNVSETCKQDSDPCGKIEQEKLIRKVLSRKAKGSKDAE